MQIISRRKTRNGLCLIKYDNEDLEKQFVNLDQDKISGFSVVTSIC